MPEPITLEVITGKDAGLKIAVPASGGILGRGPDCHISLDETTLSRKHCRILYEEGGWCVQDLASRSGVIVNGQKTSVSPLKQGDELRLGNMSLRVTSAPLPILAHQLTTERPNARLSAPSPIRDPDYTLRSDAQSKERRTTFATNSTNVAPMDKGASAMARDGYEVKRGILGKPKVAYHCPKCHNNLESGLTDAGKKDTCPLCKASFVVPGEMELREIQDAKKQAEEDRLQKEESTRQRVAEEDARRKKERAAADARRIEERKKQEEDNQKKQLTQPKAEHAAISASLSCACGKVFKPVFFLGELFSVFIIAICSLAIIVVLTYLLFVIHPQTQPVPAEPTPKAEQFRQYFIATKTPADASLPAYGQSRPAAGRRAKEENIKLAIENLLTKYHLPDDQPLANTLTEEIEQLPQHHVDRLLLGLDSFLNEMLKTSLLHSDKEVNLGEAMGWYVAQYVEELNNISNVENQNLVATQVANAKRLEAAEVVGGAFLVLMGFLIFPLLLRIERNTRALATDVADNKKSKQM
jgi:hypothetical protein